VLEKRETSGLAIQQEIPRLTSVATRGPQQYPKGTPSTGSTVKLITVVIYCT